VFGHLPHLWVYCVEQCDNTSRGSPMTGSSWWKFAQPHREPVCGYPSTCTVDVTSQTNTIG
jgi:hypothetical protein